MEETRRTPVDDATALAHRFPRSVAVVNLDAIAANVRAVSRVVGPGTGVMAIVKANAYGHGALPIAITALRAGARALAVACVDEGVHLRRAGIAVPILLLGATPAEEMARAVAHNLTPTICDAVTASAAQAAARVAGQASLSIHVKIDTGLHRFGVAADEALGFLAWLYEQPHLRVDALYTHFSCAEEEDGWATDDEAGRFAAVVAAVQAWGHQPSLHAANSAATMRYPDLRLDMVRVGLALYGLAGDYPGAERLTQWPALEIQSRVSRVLHLAAGDAVGYGRTYVAPTPRPAGLVGIGYGDGFRRALSNRGAVLVRGVRAPVLGRVSMDQIVVDLSAVGQVAPGELVTVLGRQGEAEVKAGDLAAWTDTIPYEIVTGLAPRLPRAYLRGGRLVGVSDLLGDHQMASGAADAIFRWSALPSPVTSEQGLAGGH